MAIGIPHQPGSLQNAVQAVPKVIKYGGGVVSSSGAKGGLVFTRPNLIAESQKFFQAGNLPIHLRGPRDMMIYKTAMYGSLFGITFAVLSFLKMALPKKK